MSWGGGTSRSCDSHTRSTLGSRMIGGIVGRSCDSYMSSTRISV